MKGVLVTAGSAHRKNTSLEMGGAGGRRRLRETNKQNKTLSCLISRILLSLAKVQTELSVLQKIATILVSMFLLF